MRRRFFWITLPLALGLAGCEVEDSSPQSPNPPPGPPAADGEGPVELPQPPEPPETGAGFEPGGSMEDEREPGGAREVVEETDTYLFEYSWPAHAGAIAELENLLETLLARNRERLAREAIEGRQVARANGFPFNKYSSATAWEVVADLPDWLSLSATRSTYTGGAHPNYGFDTLLWDKEGERALETAALFTSLDALDASLGEELCERLNKERARRRGEEEAGGANGGGLFDECVSVKDANILLGSRGGRRFDRIGIQMAPYVAGPYAEGDYEFTFPVTEELLQSVRPQYREAFAARN